MARRQRDHPIPAPEARPLLPRIAWGALVCWIVAVPLIVSPHGKDSFRVPKDLLFLAAGLAVIAVAAAMSIDFRLRPAFEAIRRHPVAWMSAGILFWTGVTTLTSTNRVLSEAGLLWVVVAAAIAIAIAAFARSKTINVLYWALIPAAINAIIFLLQRFRIWSPMRFDSTTPDHMQFTALIGNPDDVGSFLVAPMIVTLALIVADTRWRKVNVMLALLFGAALLTGQITSIVATVAGALVLGVIRSRRSGMITIVVLIILIPLFVFAYRPLRTRVVGIRSAIAAGDYASAFSGRITPFSAALLMWTDHPIFGVGPDCFPWQYFPYKLEAERRDPRLVAAYAHSFNFGEVHNDHLQALAETGIPGYALFLAAIWILGRWSRRDVAASDESPERRLSRIACVPLAVSLFVLCLAHFPLHLASATAMYLFIGIMCFAWSVPLVVPLEHRGSSFALLRLAGTALVLVAGAYGIYKLACHPYACNIRKREIESVTANTLNETDPMRTARRARRTLEMLSGCEEDLRHDVDFYMLAAANDRILGAQADAEAMYAKGLQLDRRPELYFGLGSVQLEQGKTAAAVASFVNAVTFNREMMNDVPAAIRPQVLAIVQRNFPYLGISQ